jgi:hypothetical protein
MQRSRGRPKAPLTVSAEDREITYNENPRPFTWLKTADEILASILPTSL